MAGCESCTLAGVIRTTRGIPLASVIIWRLQPFLARSVGFGPVCVPQKLPGPNCRQWPPARDPADLCGRGSPAVSRGSPARRPPRSIRVAAASRSRRCRSPTRRGPSARACRSAARTRSLSDRPCRAHEVGRPWAWDAQAATAAGPRFTKHRAPARMTWRRLLASLGTPTYRQKGGF